MSADLKHVYRFLPHSVPMCLLPSWSNGWLTIVRMHNESIMPCIFGCDGGEDSLHHYLRCEVLWTLAYIRSKATSIISRSQSPEERFCICTIIPQSVLRLYSAYSTYHALRKLHLDVLQNAISSGWYGEVYETAMQLIKTFYAESSGAT